MFSLIYIKLRIKSGTRLVIVSECRLIDKHKSSPTRCLKTHNADEDEEGGGAMMYLTVVKIGLLGAGQRQLAKFGGA